MKIHSMSLSSSTCYSHTKLIAVSTAADAAAIVAMALDIGFGNSHSYYLSSAVLRRILAWATI
jgi:hypothetical protein